MIAVSGLIYLHDANGLKVSWLHKFEPLEGFSAVDVLVKAFQLRLERGDHHIMAEHLAVAIEVLCRSGLRLNR